MKNHYLYITKDDDGKICVNASDGVFSSIATHANQKEFELYCEEWAKRWLESDLGNYGGWKKEDREKVAAKWIAAKDLPEGKYERYFNLESAQEIFREEVKNLAKTLGINYKDNNQVENVYLETLFQLLPEQIADETSHQVYQMSIYHYDGQCVVDYVGEIEQDSLYSFSGDTLYEAMERAWNWLRKNSNGG